MPTLTKQARAYEASPDRNCAPYAPASGNLINRVVPVWVVRKFVQWLGRTFNVQCSGKAQSGYAVMWCQHRVGHEGPCHFFNGEAFRAPESSDKMSDRKNPPPAAPAAEPAAAMSAEELSHPNARYLFKHMCRLFGIKLGEHSVADAMDIMKHARVIDARTPVAWVCYQASSKCIAAIDYGAIKPDDGNTWQPLYALRDAAEGT